MPLPIQRAYGQYTAAGTLAAINLDIGFVPDMFYAQAESAAAISEVRWLKTAGDGKCMVFTATGVPTWLTTGILAWQPAGSATFPSRWVASTAYALNYIVHPIGLTSPGVSTNLIGGSPVIQNLPLFLCTTAGTTGSSEPTWPTVIGGTVTDGTVVWTAIDSKLWSTTGIDATQQMLTGLSGVNAAGATVTPALFGLGVTVPTTCQTAGTIYDWVAEARQPT